METATPTISSTRRREIVVTGETWDQLELLDGTIEETDNETEDMEDHERDRDRDRDRERDRDRDRDLADRGRSLLNSFPYKQIIAEMFV